MNCTHPVLYAKLDGLYCHICGAKLRVDEAVDKQEGQEEKPVEMPKTGRKRKAKNTVD
jgi:hypothetical protein